MATRARVIVLERRPRWTPELKRQLAASGWSVRSCWSAAEAIAANGPPRDPIVVVDLASALDELPAYFEARTAPGRQAPTIVVAAEEHADLEWILRDLGAVAMLHDGAGAGTRLARVCVRLANGGEETQGQSADD